MTHASAELLCGIVGGSLTLFGNEADRQAFVDLGVFPEDVDIPLATAGQLWRVSDAKRIALKLANLSLIDLQLGVSILRSVFTTNS